MGAANCCKKPDEIVIDEIKNNKEEDKLNTQEQEDSYPQDTVHKTNNNQEEEINNQQLYEQDGTQKIGEPYEVPINVSSPIRNKQMEEYEQNYIQAAEYEIQDPQMQTEAVNINQYTQEEMPNMNLSSQIRISGDSETENMNSLRIRNQPEIQHSGIGEIDKAALISQQSAAPTNNLVNQIITSQQVAPTPISSHTQELNIKTNIVKQQPPLAQKEEEEENINKYFQIPPGQYTNIDDYDNMMQQNQIQAQSQKQEIKVASVTPIEENDDINKYFNQATSVNQNKLENKQSDDIDIAQYFEKSTSKEVNPKEVMQNIINMKDLPETFGSSNINNYVQKEAKVNTTSKIEKEEEAPFEYRKIEVNVNESLPETFGSSNIQQLGLNQQPETTKVTTVTKATENIKSKTNDNNNLKQITTTKKTEATGNIDLNNLSSNLTSEQINNIINMKDLPETFGSSNINNFKQTTTTTTTKTTGNVDLNNLPGNLTSSQIKNIVDMKDLPETFGSSNINNFKQTKTTTTTKTTGNADLNNLPGNLTSSQIKNIVDMKDLPETFGSSNINNFKQTTTTTTTKTTGNVDLNNLQGNLTSSQIKNIVDMKDLPETFGSSNINNFKQTKTTTTTKTTGNIDLNNLGNLTSSQIDNIINMKDLPETFGSSNINNIKKTTVTTTKTTGNMPIDLKQFGLEENSSLAQNNIDLKQFGLETNPSAMSTGQKQVTTITKTIQSSEPNEDYSKYFQQGESQQADTNIDLKQFGLEKNASGISNIIQGSNITFKPSSQIMKASNNYALNKTATTAPSASTPIEGLNNFYKTTKTISTAANAPGINLSNYGVNNTQQNVTTNTNYTGNKITTTKTTKTSYVGPTQSTGYHYSYTLPTTTNTTTTIKK